MLKRRWMPFQQNPMITQFDNVLRALRRRFSRSEWFLTLFGNNTANTASLKRGLLLIQIDGLSRPQLQKALNEGNLPFLAKLINQQRYRVHDFYSGQPSSTPAVQGELFYGVKNIVPAFSYQDRTLQKTMIMYLPSSATAIEARLSQTNEPLLKEGASYSNNFTGGAKETHFCPATLGSEQNLKSLSPLAFVFLVLTNLYSCTRLLALTLLEVILACLDFIHGISRGYNFIRELRFIPVRIIVCILLRELITISGKIDIARGLPIIHANFLGYDEQAHRRGPGSRFAHWTLRGIDKAIERLWRATQHAAKRDYDLWIYSDHGQSATIPYPVVHGKTVQAAVAEVFNTHLKNNHRRSGAPDNRGEQLTRTSFIGGRIMRWANKVAGIQSADESAEEAPEEAHDIIKTIAMGPLGFIYHAHSPLSDADKSTFAQSLVTHAHIPMVLTVTESQEVLAFTQQGQYTLPADKNTLLGEDHPFLDDVADDLATLCKHPGAGDFILCSWRAGLAPMSFPIENGAHGGPHPDETHGFALLPMEIPPANTHKTYWRPLDLRNTALNVLGRQTQTEVTTSPPVQQVPMNAQHFRLMTYNVHSCIGMDETASPERIAHIIARHNPDIIALQELDVGRARTHYHDQAQLIAEYLKMDVHFHPAIHMEEERYGNAILSRFPMRLIKSGLLPTLNTRFPLEPRGALWVSIEINGVELQLINTHLGLRKAERERQINALLGDEWLNHPRCATPRILCGDFNATPGTRVCKAATRSLVDVQEALEGHQPKGTFFTHWPLLRIDHIFADPEIGLVRVDIPKTVREKRASDHLPLIADLKLPAQ